MTYFIIFLLLSLFAVLFFKNSNNKSYHIAYFITLLIFIFIAGMRYEIGVDYFAYQYNFENSLTINDFFKSPRIFIKQFQTLEWEPLYKLYVIFLRTITKESQILFLVTSIICTTLLFKSMNYFTEKKYRFFSVLIYFSFVYMFQEMHALRQALAACFFYYALIHKCENNNVKALIYTLIAVGFHYCMILFIPIIFLLNKKINVKIQIIILAICTFIFIFNVRWLTSILNLISTVIPEATVAIKLATYASSDALERPFFITFILYFLPYLFLLYCDKKLNILSTKSYTIAINMYFFYLIFTMVFWEFAFFSIRYGWICLWGMSVCLPKIIEGFKYNSQFAPINYIIIFCFIIIVTFLFPNHTTIQFTPYDNYIECKWFGHKGTGKERAEQYLHSLGRELNY